MSKPSNITFKEFINLRSQGYSAANIARFLKSEQEFFDLFPDLSIPLDIRSFENGKEGRLFRNFYYNNFLFKIKATPEDYSWVESALMDEVEISKSVGPLPREVFVNRKWHYFSSIPNDLHPRSSIKSYLEKGYSKQVAIEERAKTLRDHKELWKSILTEQKAFYHLSVSISMAGEELGSEGLGLVDEDDFENTIKEELLPTLVSHVRKFLGEAIQEVEKKVVELRAVEIPHTW